MATETQGNTENVTIYLRETFDHLTDGMPDIRVTDDGKVYSDNDNKVIDTEATVDSYLDEIAAILEGQGYTIGEKAGRRRAYPDWHNYYGYGYHDIDLDQIDDSDAYDIARSDLEEAISQVFGAGTFWVDTGETIED